MGVWLPYSPAPKGHLAHDLADEEQHRRLGKDSVIGRLHVLEP
jgi:hypothetical protein